MMTSLDIEELYARLRAKENSKIVSSEEIHNRNLQWLKDITDEAKGLFKKECKKEITGTVLEESETLPCKEVSKELDDSGCSNIILLPKTPRVRILNHYVAILIVLKSPSLFHNEKLHNLTYFVVLGKESSCCTHSKSHVQIAWATKLFNKQIRQSCVQGKCFRKEHSDWSNSIG